ncbi:hypothetical protein JYT28_01010, partial [Desulfobulbus sp. AH-315-M07]|nr:hypothetical protein [Desulfobulbus sp. AH-315-M07]
RRTDYDRIVEGLSSVKVVRYRYKTDRDDRRKRIGVIAEDAPKDIVTPDGKRVSLAEYNGYLLAALKGQQMRIAGQQVKLKGQQTKLKALEARLTRLERVCNATEASAQ